jgi:hypothetical protein
MGKKLHTAPVEFCAQWMASGFPPVTHTPAGLVTVVDFDDRSDGTRHSFVTPNYDAA